MLKRWLIAALLALSPTAALAQGAVLQQGGVFQGHAAQWLSNGYVADAGGPTANGLSPVDPVSGLLPLGFASVNSGLGTCQFSAYGGVPHSFFCLGFDGNGNGLLNLGATNSAISFSVTINGVNYPFPGNLAANAILPTSPPIPNGDLIALNTGFLLKDGGPPLPTFAQGDIMSATAPSGPTALQARYADTGVNILDFNRTACSGSDDTAALLAALATGQDVNLPGGGVTCNFNTANYAAAIWPVAVGNGYAIGDTVGLTGGLSGTVYSLGLSSISQNNHGGSYAPGDVVTLVANQLWAKNALTNAVWASSGGGTLTFTCTTSCGVLPGQTFVISGMSPGGYNGKFFAIAGTGGSTLVAIQATNPGTYMVLGQLSASPMIDSAATITVNTVSAGAIATYTILTPGLYTNQLPISFTTTGGSGSGATWNTPIWGVSSVTPNFTTAAASKPSNPVSQASSSGSGTGATYNVTYAVVPLTAAGQSISGQGEDSTNVSSTASGSVLVLMTNNGQSVANLTFNLAAMTDGWTIFDYGGAYITVQNVFFNSVPGTFAASGHSGQVLVQNIRIAGVSVGGTEGLLNRLSGSDRAEVFGFAPQSKISSGLFLENVIAGLKGSTAQFLVFDGYYQSSRLLQLGINNPGLACFRTQNNFDSSQQPAFVNSNFFDCQTPQGNGWSIPTGQAFKFIGNFCNGAGANCVAISGGAGGPSDIEFSNNRFNGATQSIFSVSTDGYVKIDGGYLSNSGQNGGTCTADTSNLCPLIAANATVANLVVTNATLTNSAGFGVEALNGAAGIRLSGNQIVDNALGALQNDGTQDCSGISVLDWGPCLQIYTVTHTASFNITAADFVNGLANGATTALEIAGASSGAITATSPTATAALAVLPGGGFVGQTWTLLIENETAGGNVTLAGGSGVTITNPSMIGVGSYRKFNCVVTATGTPAVTCTGQANQNS